MTLNTEKENLEVALTSLDLNGFYEVADELCWQKHHITESTCTSTWRSNDMDAIVTWFQVDATYGAFIIKGTDADLMISDLALAFELLDDVAVLQEIAGASNPLELVKWASRLGPFAAGDFQESTLDVILGLLNSERPDFVAAMVSGLQCARWPELRAPLALVAVKYPTLSTLCEVGLSSIASYEK